ncbi:porin [Aquicoccus sp. G2-2]|uniref:porin n=1 Tax=Aquicoccus sp. G2-2 TaxID=3092120 RepID=UPI002ADF2A3F|nr:porin [Aquicoccus sp. G2-2]MEA1114528.1 porin [Aquicoccus sp. G2-2]
MKKILFATTAIVATASVAAADVSFSGYGRFGVVHLGAAPSSSMVYSRLRLQIDMTTEADNGLTFGARLRHEQDNNKGFITSSTTFVPVPAAGVGAFNAARFYAKAGGFEVGTGNIYGAIEFMPGNYAATQSAGTGLSGLGFQDIVTGNSGGWDAYSSKGNGAAGRQGVEVRYSAGDFSGHLSYSKGGGTKRTAAFVAYTFNGWTAALGYQDGNVGAVANDIVALTVSGKIGNFGLDIGMSDVSGATNNRYVVRGYMDVGAATKLNAYISNQKGAGAEDNSFGLGVSHSLGGGASVEGGVVRDFAGNTNADLGVRFNF